MIARLRRSFRIWKQCLQVLLKDKELLLFPIMSFLLLIPVALSFILPLSATINLHEVQNLRLQVWHYLLLFLFYLVSYTVIIFFNSGLVGCATMRLDGKDPVASDGLRIGLENFSRIVGWALVAATVGFLLKLLERIRLGGDEDGGGFAIGYLVSSLLGLAWSLMTYLVVPVLVVEKVGPVASVKRSIDLFKKTWGEQVIGGMSLGLVIFLLALLGILPILLGSAAGGPVSMVLGIVVAVVYWFALGAVHTALNGIYQAALYQYATTGEVPAEFDRDSVEGAFQPRSQVFEKSWP